MNAFSVADRRAERTCFLDSSCSGTLEQFLCNLSGFFGFEALVNVLDLPLILTELCLSLVHIDCQWFKQVKVKKYGKEQCRSGAHWKRRSTISDLYNLLQSVEKRLSERLLVIENLLWNACSWLKQV